MTVPALAFSASVPPSTDLDVVVIGATVTNGSVALVAASDFGAIAAQLDAIGFGGGKDELVRLPRGAGEAPVAVIGIPAERTEDALRYAAGSAIRQLAGFQRVAVAIPFSGDAEAGALLEGAALGAYAFTAYRVSSAASVKEPVSSVVIVGDVADADALVTHATAVAEAVTLVKDLVNTPPLDLYPASLARAAADSSEGLPVDVTIWDEAALEAEGFGGILGVGQGSTRGPRLVKVAYSPAGAGKHLALVGKGITFDTGGLSLKPPTGMVGMKYDMTGAATVLAVTLAAAQLQLPVRVTAWLCIAENMPSGNAIRPNDVLRIRGGKTVEVLNTDAEGRLVMADGLVAASEEHPDAIVDVATLTGAAMVALGTRYAAVMGDDAFVGQVVDAATATGELLWPMPLPGELRATINSDIADIANANPGNTAGGMLLAGVFLQEFVGTNGDGDDAARIPWAHLDIAGPAKGPAAPYGFTGKGPSAVSVRALIRLAEDFSRQ
ncbi:leucyl aminopeptidase [Diaminobutyricibacter sp. McL0608]|uniref:leucyl aminopeptidase n=1 Tax=Leifsonia sp. McL0608 TaxID=3143537 RepID=UPI0031F32D9F